MRQDRRAAHIQASAGHIEEQRPHVIEIGRIKLLAIDAGEQA
jgi:hypothetical protein